MIDLLQCCNNFKFKFKIVTATFQLLKKSQRIAVSLHQKRITN